MKYIFVAGAPGSKWSSVVKNIYFSPNIDQTDYSNARTYYHDASGVMDLMHLGAYFDPGMEFGENFCRIHEKTREECEAEFDRPFTGTGTRIIKSHVFCHHLDFLRENWPDAPIITVHRPDDACLGWWVKCGHFNITYPLYDFYYRDLRTMAFHIAAQNHDLLSWEQDNAITQIKNNRDLCQNLGIAQPPETYYQDYAKSDIVVKISHGKKNG